jgi:hypothetical protein
VLAKLPPSAVAPLFDFLLSMEGDGYSIGLDLLGMYVHSDGSRLDLLRPQLRLIAQNVGAHPKNRRFQMIDHHFGELMNWILAKGRDDRDASTIALSLAKQLVAVDADHHENFIKPLLPRLFLDFPEIVWPLLGRAIVSDRKAAWRFEQLLGDSFAGNTDPPLLRVPENVLFAWCYAYPDAAPAFVAGIMSVLTSRDPNDIGRTLHPIMHRLLDEFGNRADVLSALTRNMYSFGWSGSLATYFALYDVPLSDLETHRLGSVRRWAKKTRLQLRRAAEEARNEDDERDAMWGA